MRQKSIFDDYEGFVDKFKPKKTTDDCYTTPAVYDVVLDYVGKLVDLTGREVVRPFYPGGDFERFDYPPNCVVVDNPPFSIYAKIVRWYLANKIDFFLFAPSMTQSVPGADVCYIISLADLTYENGANVKTSFTTNLIKDYRIVTNGDFKAALEKAGKKPTKAVTKICYPGNFTTPPLLGKISGQTLRIKKVDCVYYRSLDNYKNVFGTGFLLNDRAAADVRLAEEAERREAEKSAKGGGFVVTLSERERKIIDMMNKAAGVDAPGSDS